MIEHAGGVQALSAALFGIGVFGFLARRNFILMLVSVEVMLNAVNLSLAGFSHQLRDPRGQVLAQSAILNPLDARRQVWGIGELRAG